MSFLNDSCSGVRGQGAGWFGSDSGQLWPKRMETESAERKAVMACSLVMRFEGGSDDGGGEVGRGRAPALQAKRRTARRCIFTDRPFKTPLRVGIVGVR